MIWALRLVDCFATNFFYTLTIKVSELNYVLALLTFLKILLLGDEYTCLEFCRKPTRRDIGSRIMYRDAHMTGWAYKIVQESDMKFPMVYGEGKRSRLLATIGVTRGFGDHDLRAQSQNGTIYIKPFLSPQPEVILVYTTKNGQHSFIHP